MYCGDRFRLFRIINADASTALSSRSIYDTRDRLIETRLPHDSVISHRLDANGNLLELTDARGNRQQSVYDNGDRIVSSSDRAGGISRYRYDAQDRIIQVTAPNGAITRYAYDIIGRRTQEISPDRGEISYDYDLADNITRITDARGITLDLRYDALERLTHKTYPNSDEDVRYVYDDCAYGIERLCVREDASGRYNYRYDVYGNIKQQTYSDRDQSYQQSYDYDAGDNITQMTLPSGRVIDYRRDGLRRLSGITSSVNGKPQDIIGNLAYRADHQPLQGDYGNGLQDQRRYDQQGRLLSQQLQNQTTIVDSRRYDYDRNSNVTSIDSNRDDHHYRYDKRDRIIQDGLNTEAIQFIYDANDNRLGRKQDEVDEILRYGEQSNRLRQSDSLQPDTADLTLINRQLDYNQVGRLSQLHEEGNRRAAYLYNDNGQRVRKTLYAADGSIDSIRIYHYDLMGNLITETSADGDLIRDYIWQEGMLPVAQIDKINSTEVISYLHTDHLMTTRLATDATGAVIWRWQGEAFGNTAAEELAGISINLRFPGQYYDAETNLHYNWNRYYDPALGRYITSDPRGLSGGMNMYGYADASPIQTIDIMGLSRGSIGPRNPWNSYQSRNRGRSSSENRGPYRQNQLNTIGKGDRSDGSLPEPKAGNRPCFYRTAKCYYIRLCDYRCYTDERECTETNPYYLYSVDSKHPQVKEGNCSIVGGTCRWKYQ